MEPMQRFLAFQTVLPGERGPSRKIGIQPQGSSPIVDSARHEMLPGMLIRGACCGAGRDGLDGRGSPD